MGENDLNLKLSLNIHYFCSNYHPPAAEFLPKCKLPVLHVLRIFPFSGCWVSLGALFFCFVLITRSSIHIQVPYLPTGVRQMDESHRNGRPSSPVGDRSGTKLTVPLQGDR